MPMYHFSNQKIFNYANSFLRNVQIYKFNKLVGKILYLERNFLRVLRLRLKAVCKAAGPVDRTLEVVNHGPR